MHALTTLALLPLLAAGADDDDFPREKDLSALEGRPAPALAVAQWRNAEPTTLEALRGKVVLLDFWGTW